MMSASKTLKKNLSIAVTAVFLAVAAFACWAIEPSKAYADTTDSHLTVASEVHVLVDSEGNVTIPNATVTNDGTCAAYIMGYSSPDGLSWTCDAVGKRIEVGQSITATWRSTGPVSDEIAAQLGEEPYYAGNLTYTYTDGDLKGTVMLDNTDPTVGDTITATVTGANVPDDKLTYQWYRVKDGVEAAIDGAMGSTYTATDDDAGYELVCKVSSTDDICQGTICGATGAVKKIQAFAVYSADDNSLNFYKRAGMPNAGDQFEGKTATATYTGIEDTNGSQPWSEYMSDIKTATVVDSGIQPKNTAFWFTRCVNMTQFDASKLDVSQTTNMMLMFSGCSSLTDLSSLAGWDTSKVTNMGNMFSSLSRITDLSSISGWNTSSVTNMGGMLAGLTTPIALDLSSWDTSKVTNMGNMFSSSSGISTVGDLSNWDTSKVTTMDSMFYGCSSLTFLALSGWDTSKVSNMDNMCDFCNNLQLVMLGDKWQWVGTKGYLPTPDPQYITGADGKWYDTDRNGYAPEDIPSNKAMTYTAVAPKTAFAVYSADDQSLNFYKRSGVPAAGDTFEGKKVTAVYTGIETDTYIGSWQSNVPQNPASYLDTSPWAAYKSTIKTITAVDKIQPKSLDFWFSNPKSWATATAVTSADLSNIDTSKITSMSNLFTGCSNLTSLNISNWNVSNVTNMTNMFSVYSGMFRTQPACSSLTTLDLSNWDTSNVTSMSGMFNGMTHLQQVTFGSNWKWVGTNGYLPTPSSTYITGADGKWYDIDGNGYAPADVPSNKAMTYYASKDLLPKAFAVYSDDDQSLNFYKRSAVPAAGEQFEGKTATATYTGIEDTNGSVSWSPWSKYESSIKTATVVDDGIQPKSTACWFYACAHMTQCDISKLDTSKVTNMNRMFRGCYSLTALDVSSFDTSKVTNMIDMFRGCSKLTALDVLSFDTSNVVNMNCMFNSCSSLTSLDLSSFDTNNVTYMNNMFSYCPNLTTVGDLSSWDTSNVTDTSYMFTDCSKLTTLDLSSWNTSSLTNASDMFSSCSSLTSLGDLSSWDTSNVTDMRYMFSGCTNLTSIGNLSSWNTSNVTNMRDMFSYCSSLTSLGDLSSWNTSKVTNMRSTFYGCFKLSADCSNWDVSKVTDHRYFNADASGVILPSAWQTSSDEGVKDSTIAPLCEEQGNGDALSVSDENGNDEAASKTDGKASADSETEGNATTSADDVDVKGEEAPGDIAQEDPIAA